MAKQPTPSVEYFNLVVGGIAPENLGATMAALAKLGLTDVRPELVTEIATFRKKTQHDTTAEDFVGEWTASNPTFSSKALIAHSRAAGRTDASIYGAVRGLVQAGKLKKLSAGHYCLPEVSATVHATRERREVSNKEFIWDIVKNRKAFTSKELRTAFIADGRNERSLSPQLQILVEEKRIKALGDGEYQVLKGKATKGKATKASETERKERDRLRAIAYRKAKKAAAMNGAEAANG